jgi:F-type H+/Na+-transporting ATPase subunit alpha
MAEVSIRPEDIRDALAKHVAAYKPGAAVKDEIGSVTEAGDGIARVEGLPSTMTNELLKFENGTLGLALNLDVREIGVVILGEFTGIEEGTTVRRTGEILSVPVGDGFLGRVVDALGRPIDGKGEIKAETTRALEIQAPSVVQRQPVKEPMQTGIKAIDSMTAIGRGQRQLIIGDRQTGKTAIAVDTIINQLENWKSGDPKKQVKCIYVAIGQKGSTIASVKGALEEAGAMAYTTIVAAPASDPAGFKYLAPYTGSSIGQHWMYKGQHVLIVFDDLSKQAEAYRSVSLLLRRPPGREAYPGDVFYLHSRLLERCAKLSDELGGGSMTGLPIIKQKVMTYQHLFQRMLFLLPMVSASLRLICLTPAFVLRLTLVSQYLELVDLLRLRRLRKLLVVCVLILLNIVSLKHSQHLVQILMLLLKHN